MGLVDYSDSDSETNTSKPTTAPKKSFQKLVDTNKPGKIRVNLPQASTSAGAEGDEPSAKRVKLGSTNSGGNRFSGFSSFLPAPKKSAATPQESSPNTSRLAGAPRVGIHLKTSAEAAFSREPVEQDDDYDEEGGGGSSRKTSLVLPPLSGPTPSIPEGQKPAEQVKLVGKPLMFKPLSVARRPGQKGKKRTTQAAGGTITTASAQSVQSAATAPETATVAPIKKVSLFGATEEDVVLPEQTTAEEMDVEPYPEEPDYRSYNTPDQGQPPYQQPQHEAPPDSSGLSSIADSLNLDARARRELFGRNPSSSLTSSSAVTNVVNFNLDAEYAHNQSLLASGEARDNTYNPVKALNPGKHSLRQLVNAVHTQKDALEDKFVANKGAQRQAGAKYGWR